jgi:CRP-like cAMP-binding protein
MAIDDEVKVLADLPVFIGADQGALKLLAFASELVTFLPGDMLFRQGDPSETALIILDGEAEVTVLGATGPVTVAVLGARQIVGEMGVLTGSSRSATVVARSRINTLSVPREVLVRFIEAAPTVSMALIREFATRLERSNAIIAGLAKAGD